MPPVTDHSGRPSRFFKLYWGFTKNRTGWLIPAGGVPGIPSQRPGEEATAFASIDAMPQPQQWLSLHPALWVCPVSLCRAAA